MVDDDPEFHVFAAKKNKESLLSFMRDVQSFKSILLQPLGGRQAGHVMAQQICEQFLKETSPNVVVEINPSTRVATLEAWTKLAHEPSKLQRTFFDLCRTDAQKGLDALHEEFRAYKERVARQEKEKQQQQQQQQQTPHDSVKGQSGGVLSFLRRTATTPTTAAEHDDANNNSNNNNNNNNNNDNEDPKHMRGSGGGAGTDVASFASVASDNAAAPAKKPLPLKVIVKEKTFKKAAPASTVAVRDGSSGVAAAAAAAASHEAQNQFILQVSLLVAQTQLSWDVERSYDEFKALYAKLKRYHVSTLSALPKTVLHSAPSAKKLEAWLSEVLTVPALTASRDMYAFLCIGRTVDLLAKATKGGRPTTMAVGPAAASPVTPLSKQVPLQQHQQHQQQQQQQQSQQQQGGTAVFEDPYGFGENLSKEDLALAFTHLEELMIEPDDDDERGVSVTPLVGRKTVVRDDEFDDDDDDDDDNDDASGSKNGSVRARKAGAAEEGISAQDIAAALEHLMNLQFTDSPNRRAAADGAEDGGNNVESDLEEEDEPDDDDDDDDVGQERDDEAVTGTHSAPSTADTFEYPALANGSGNLKGAADSVNKSTSEFDLRAIVAEQAQTIEAQRLRIKELEALVAKLQQRKK